MGLADLFVVANRIAEGIDQIPSRLRVRHLRTGKGADPAPAFDTDPDTAMNHTGPSDVLVLPPSLEAPISTDVAAPLARWLRKRHGDGSVRSEEHTSELQSLMRISYAVFCLKKKKKINN